MVAQALGINIEPLHEIDKDLDAVEAIDRASFSSHTHLNAREELIRPFAATWIARPTTGAGGQEPPVGFILTWAVVDEVHVLNVACDPRVRRMGVGRALMNHAIGMAIANKAKLILLEVRVSNVAAIALYRSLGFCATNYRRGYYDNGEDALEMALVLDPETGHIVPGRDEVRLEEV